MRLQYVDKIKANISISASKKTSNLLDGLYRSIFKGRSMDFDDLRDYVLGDNTKDIDWKSSIRHGSLLVRRYVAFKRHNIMFIIDSGVRFSGENSNGEKKSETSMYTFGTLSYLVNKNEDDVACVYNKNKKIYMSPFKQGLKYLEMNLDELEEHMEKENLYTVNDLLEYALNNSKRKMIVIVITDIKGLNSIDINLVKRLIRFHDMMVVNINDRSMSGESLFDLDEESDIPNFISRNKKIKEIEKEEREKIIKEKSDSLKKYRITTCEIGSKKEIVNKLIDLLERHNNAVRR